MFEQTQIRLSFRLATPVLEIDRAALRAVIYSDVFDYPLTATEIHRYLIGAAASPGEVRAALDERLAPSGWLEARRGYYTLVGRSELVERRETLLAHNAQLWPRALRYGRWLAALPYVRMAALTGALTMRNEPGRDLDFLVITESGRLWLCRGLAMLLTRLARRFGDELCPNYFISLNALEFPNRDLYTAHEVTQMTPLAAPNGAAQVYQKLRCLNAWTERFLPNAVGAPVVELSAPSKSRFTDLSEYGRRALEMSLRSAAGDRIEAWEMRRKIRKLNAQRGPSAEADFSADWCKGHFGGYGRRTLEAYAARLRACGLEEDAPLFNPRLSSEEVWK